MRTGTRGSSPRNYKQNKVTSPQASGARGARVKPGGRQHGGYRIRSNTQVTDTARWWQYKEGVPGGQTGRVERGGGGY